MAELITPMAQSYMTFSLPARTPIPSLADALALRQAVSGMANWRRILIANGEPHDKYDADIAKARAALEALEAFVGAFHG